MRLSIDNKIKAILPNEEKIEATAIQTSKDIVIKSILECDSNATTLEMKTLINFPSSLCELL